ncbi:MAG: M23 family metallopeptidase [Acidobacteriota bacterium]|nr:MAG: M23 family metallopeptidase [Acidobacteriota bacterium]
MGTNTFVALFALAHDQAASEEDVKLWAEDRAGNRTEAGFWIRINSQKFRSRRIEVSDRFIESVVPEILLNTPEIVQQDSSLDTFLVINRDLRRANNQKISEVSLDSRPELLWLEPFLQLSKSKVEAVFADHRSYFYQGRQVDEQTHLGFDLASYAQSPVEASNSGVVAFADYHGIYGNMVMVDHGLGLFSLYAHLSSIAVEPGQMVNRGESLGRTGATGLAGGDHLHFSMVLQGVQVNPLEWWDVAWVRTHLFNKLPAGSGFD